MSQLQVADNRAFTNPITDFNIDLAQAWALTQPLPSGKLYWRVLGVDVARFELLVQIEQRCLALPAFANAVPDRQPDAVKP